MESRQTKKLIKENWKFKKLKVFEEWKKKFMDKLQVRSSGRDGKWWNKREKIG